MRPNLYGKDRKMTVHYYPLINKVLTSLKIRDSVSLPFKHDEAAFVKPFITIAREPGSGGAPIAKLVAEKLGFTFVDEQIVEEIAKSTKKRKAIIKEIDEKSRSRIQDIVHSVLNEEYVDDLRFTRELTQIILTYAHKGHVVILGRGANFLTPFAKGLHINIVAPYQVRVNRAMEFEGLNSKEAKRIIADVEAERRDFVKQYIKKDPKKFNAYDLSLNTTYYPVKEAAQVIIEAFYRKFPRLVRYGSMFK